MKWRSGDTLWYRHHEQETRGGHLVAVSHDSTGTNPVEATHRDWRI